MLNSLKWLEKQGYEVTLLDVYENGIVKVEDLVNALRDDTVLVSVVFAKPLFSSQKRIKHFHFNLWHFVKTALSFLI